MNEALLSFGKIQVWKKNRAGFDFEGNQSCFSFGFHRIGKSFSENCLEHAGSHVKTSGSTNSQCHKAGQPSGYHHMTKGVTAPIVR